ncbi:MAG: hypothetical protein AAF288_05385 [Planctomycetota bacterium]
MNLTANLTRRSPIGLDIGRRRIHAVQFDAGRGQRIAAAVSLTRTHDTAELTAEESERLQNVLERSGFRGRAVVVAARPENTVSAAVQGPAGANDTQLDAVVRHEVARIGAAEPGQMEIAWWPLPAGPRTAAVRECLAVGLTHAGSEALLGPLEAVGFEPRAIDTPATALHRVVAPALGADEPAGPGFAVLIDVGWSGARLYLLDARRVRYQRALDEPALGQELRAISARFGSESLGQWEKVVLELVTGVEADEHASPVAAVAQASLARIGARLAAEAQTSADYARRRDPDSALQALVVCGGGAALAPLISGMEQGVDAPVTVCDAVSLGLDVRSADAAGYDPGMALAAGLARWGGR